MGIRSIFIHLFGRIYPVLVWGTLCGLATHSVLRFQARLAHPSRIVETVSATFIPLP